MVDAEGSSPLSALFSLSCACTIDVASSLVDYSALPLCTYLHAAPDAAFICPTKRHGPSKRCAGPIHGDPHLK
jgi:hypothetical protein